LKKGIQYQHYGRPDINRAALWQVLDSISSLGVALLTFQQQEILEPEELLETCPIANAFGINKQLKCLDTTTSTSLIGSKVDALKFIVPLIDCLIWLI
jgi:hypothetical protein